MREALLGRLQFFQSVIVELERHSRSGIIRHECLHALMFRPFCFVRLLLNTTVVVVVGVFKKL